MAEQTDIDTNPYVAVPTLTQEAAIFSSGNVEDTRSIVDTTGKTNFLSRIGQLRMTYASDSNSNSKAQQYNGTATVFAASKNDDGRYSLYAVTCAHNLQLVDPMQPQLMCQKVAFEVRESSKTGSKTVKTFEATPDDWYVHPQYDPRSRIPSHDLAMICFAVNEEDATHFKNMDQDMSKLDETVICVEDASSSLTEKAKNTQRMLHIYGFPVSTKGKLCGLSKQAEVQENTEMGILQYDVPTSPGQSGSPIMKIEQTRIPVLNAALLAVFAVILSMCSARGISLESSFDLAVLFTVILCVGSLAVASKLGVDISNKTIVLNEKCWIAGIHTTGNITGNMGVKVTKDIIKWMKECIAKSQGNAVDQYTNNAETEQESLYCMKVTPFI